VKNKVVRLGKKVIGNVEGDTLNKIVDSSKHFLRTPPAIAFDELALSKAEELGATKIKVKDKLTGITYHSTIDAVRSRGFAFNRGFGSQVGLALSEWSKNEESQIKIFDSTE
jgi:homoserine trans-succinylase|tara:strand:+ start:737 stop:1072 length:336 start_codon:yes stop_codon:yes gene_type:complete